MLALKWIQKNIRSLNGDPSRVSLIGHSSGGTIIYALQASPLARGLFAGVVSLSGSPNITMNAATAQAKGDEVVRTSGSVFC